MAAISRRSPTSFAKLLHIDGGEENERGSYLTDNKITYEKLVLTRCAWRGTMPPEDETPV